MDKRELEETVTELKRWKATQEIQQGIRHGTFVRCMAAVGIIWAGLTAIGAWAVDNFEVVKAMVKAGIEAKFGK